METYLRSLGLDGMNLEQARLELRERMRYHLLTGLTKFLLSRLEKELASVQSLAAEAKQRKLLEEAKLADFGNRLKTFVEVHLCDCFRILCLIVSSIVMFLTCQAAKPMVEYFHDRPAPSSSCSPSLASSMAEESHASQRNERAKQAQASIITAKHFPTPLYILYQAREAIAFSFVLSR